MTHQNLKPNPSPGHLYSVILLNLIANELPPVYLSTQYVCGMPYFGLDDSNVTRHCFSGCRLQPLRSH